MFWQAALAERQAEALSALTARPGWVEAVDLLETCCANGDSDLMEVARQEALAAVRGAAGRPLSAALVSLSRLAGIKLTGGSAKQWPDGKEQLTEVKAALRTLREGWCEAGVLKLAWSPLDEAVAAQMPALRRLWDFALTGYEDAKRARSAVDFDDLEAGALALLHDPAVCGDWQREVRAILVDEFQDTNARQRDLVSFLDGGGHKLFLVGDAKQSIYRFRGADVAVFRDERERVAREGGVVRTLDTSYRAHRRLIEGLNDLMRPVLGDEADPDRPWIEPFAALKPDREDPRKRFGGSGDATVIELHLGVGAKSERALERAAQATASRIAEMVATGAIGYGDVAVLCRASGSFAPYEDAFESAGIPFLTVAGRGFYDRPEIRDLLNALRALADPTDDLALVGLLRSPVIGLTDAELYALKQEEGASGCFWDRLRAAPGSTKGARAVDLIERLHERVGRTPVADVLKAFLDETSYRAALIWAGQRRGARNAGKLLADAHVSGIVGVGEFLEYVAQLRDTGAREGEARTEADGAVQIMSVHAAKGLEFPVVVIGDVAYRRATRNEVLLDPELGVLLPTRSDDSECPTMYRLGKGRADDQEEAESNRLFYVAATRAQEKLILSGQVTLSKKDRCVDRPGGWLGRIAGAEDLGLAGLEMSDYTEDGTEVRCYDLGIGATSVACNVYEPECPACAGPPIAAGSDGEITQAEEADGATQGEWPLLEPVIAAAAAQEPEAEPQRQVWWIVPSGNRPTAPAWVVGQLVHEALAAWRFPGSDGVFERWVSGRARSHGLTDDRQIGDAAREVRRLLERFHAHSLFAEMAGAERRLHEVPYCLPWRSTDASGCDAEPEYGVMDALIYREGAWTVIEFKTDDVRGPGDWERALEEKGYRRQAERYVRAAKELLGVLPRFVFCLLNYQGRVETRPGT